MARIVPFPAPPGYQSRWEWPGKLGNRTPFQRRPTTRSVKRTGAGAAEKAVKQAAHGRQSHPKRRLNLLGMLRNRKN